MRIAAFAILCLSCLALDVRATRTGDEDYGADGSGVYYTFASQVVHIIAPYNLSIIKNISTGVNGMPLTNSGATGGSNNTSITWNDAAFVEDAENDLRFVVVNEGDVYRSGGSSYSYVSVIDAVRQQFAARIRVGPRPVHIYSINQTNTIWSHSDAEGIFYIIPVDNPANLTVSKTVPAFVGRPGHGKLVINNALYPIGYGTNVNEAILPKFNLMNETRIGNFTYNTSLPDSTVCTGTHTIVYSRINRHIYAECVDGAGVLEWNTANDTFVRLHTNAPGVVTGAPADDIIFVGNNTESSAILLQPGANGRPSTVYATLGVPYNPDYPAFYSPSTNETTQGNFTDYTIFFPLTRNTNLNNIRAVGNNSATVTTEAYMERPSDCQYANASSVMTASVGGEGASGQSLRLATAANNSVLTPMCGACAAGINTTNPSQFNANLSGFGFLNLGVYSSGGPSNLTTRLVAAGATLPRPNLATGANQCSFSTEAHRAIKRGGPYIATVADLPMPSVWILNASAASNPGFVPTANSPSKLVWVPEAAS